jgi:hypothetical protein
VQGTIGGTNWYRLQSAGTNPGVLSVQSSCNCKPTKVMMITRFRLTLNPRPLYPFSRLDPSLLE